MRYRSTPEVKVLFNGEGNGDRYYTLTIMATTNGYEKVDVNDDPGPETQ